MALYPVVQHARACIGLSLSLDGKEWSELTPLLRCKVHGERAEDQPIALALLPRSANISSRLGDRVAPIGSAASRDGVGVAHAERIALYVQERVPDVAYDEWAPPRLYHTHFGMALKRGGSHVVRHIFPCGVLAHWTSGALRELATHGRADGQRPMAARLLTEPSRYECPPIPCRS